MKESFDNGPDYERAKIDRMVEFVNDVIEQGEERIAAELWREFLESHSNPFVVQEYWGEDLQCYFCDGKPDHRPDCIYLRAKALMEE